MSKTRVGIIGFGLMGRGHADYIFKGEVPGAELTAVCDIDPAALAIAQEKYGDKVKAFSAANEFYRSGLVDAVLVATPHYDHPGLSIQAFAAGLHVMVEKPVGVYTGQTRDLHEAAKRSGKVFGVMFNNRSLKKYQKLKELIVSGELGEIRRSNWIITDWYRTQFYYNLGTWRATWGGEGGGVLTNQCPHNLDLWQWLCGLPKRIRAFCHFGKHHDIEVEDEVTAYAEYANGATGVFVASTCEAPGTNRLELTGDRGKIVMEGEKLTFYRNRESVSRHLREAHSGFDKPECWTCDIPFAETGENIHRLTTQAWIRKIRGEGELIAGGEEGRNSLELANAMLLSTWTDNWVELPVNEDLFYARLQEKIASSRHQPKQAK